MYQNPEGSKSFDEFRILNYCLGTEQQESQLLKTSVADPDPFDTDPDPAFHFDTDPDTDPAFHFDTDPDTDPAFQFDTDPDPTI